ncbi:YfjI family protein [Novosphingobium marinum]|uniref:DUF3987 domain-containing protein n=2 Tax=Novosphingobium marinum TaxID=1514948 RepID=A0A7Y9XWD3_9SPHN|nr:YfjI family protein [Novosphingobium marinum]NYH94538.1 hypothetical protein [Novosphingobium marinum]
MVALNPKLTGSTDVLSRPTQSSDWRERRVMTFRGQHDTHIKTGEDYSTISLGEIFRATPARRAKSHAPAMIPSTYHDFDGRNHKRQQEEGTFVALAGDIDDGDHPLETVVRLVKDFAGASAWLVYSSSSSRPGNRKWRIILPLEEAVAFPEWNDAQNAFFDVMENHGVKMDRALGYAGQPVFLPNVPDVHDGTGTRLRNEDGWTLYYERETSGADAPGLPLDRGPVAERIRVIEERRARDDALKEKIRREAQRKRQERIAAGDESLIDAFNAANDVETLLLSHGYKQSPRNPKDWRSPNQTSDSYATRVEGDKWISLSGSDADAGLGARHPSGCYGDAFDLFVHYEHGGNRNAAFRALHQERGGETPLHWRNDNLATNRAEHSPANPEPSATDGPQPLFREVGAPAPYPVDAMGPVLARAALALEALVDLPIASAANSVLAVASLAAQGCANAILPIDQGTPVPLSLYLLTVLDSGDRKSTADKKALKPIHQFERELKEIEAGQRQKYDAEMAAYDTHIKHLKNKLKSDRHALQAALMEMGPPPHPPLSSVIAPAGDQTIEGLFRIYQYGRPSLAMLCDDAGTFLGGYSLKAEQKISTTGILCRAWDGSKLERIRGGDGNTMLYDRRLAMHLMVQSGLAQDFLGDERFSDQGLLARFLIAAPKSYAGKRIRDDVLYQQQVSHKEAHLAAYHDAIDRLVRRPIRWRDSRDPSLGVELDSLHLTAEARALWVDFANELEQKMGPGGELASLKAFASKLPENAGRIAGILTLVNDPDAVVIERDTLASAITIANHYLSETVRLTNAGGIDPELRRAAELLKWLNERGDPVIGLSTIYQYGPASIRDAKKAREAMGVLAEHRWVKSLKGGAEIDGKRVREAWRVTSRA